eukprot:TRINITY_DN13351_c0_g1_i1.p1 TRINITY_DN13351_c0_g1~~TRINITY_DN13351_c0_g1_i1.p1  ORF type:complete len:465 (+),score=42.62 TRINITY_DN13351_c0_g1_i1:23-1417(+)
MRIASMRPGICLARRRGFWNKRERRFDDALVDSFLRENQSAMLVDVARALHLPASAAADWGYHTMAVHTSTIAANRPTEDRHAFHRVPFSTESNGANAGFLLTVCDGHGGPQCSNLVANVLPHYAALWLCQQRGRAFLDSLAPAWGPYVESLGFSVDPPLGAADALLKAFETVDAGLLALSSFDPTLFVLDPGQTSVARVEILDRVKSALSGCVSNQIFINGNEVIVANTGDCRAVMGEVDYSSSTAKAYVLSDDHTARNPREIERLRRDHEGERVVTHGRVFGSLMPTRAFGDFGFKVSVDTVPVFKHFAGAHRNAKDLLTPPYVIATPEVTHMPLGNNCQRFVILATDGLWETVHSATAVAHIAEILTGARPLKNGDNLATHLVRRALGKDDASVELCLETAANHPRSHYDDTTVIVVVLDPPRKPWENLHRTNAMPDIAGTRLLTHWVEENQPRWRAARNE